MKEFFEWTAWTMDKPKSYGTFHLVFLFVGLAVAIFLAIIFRRFNEKKNKILLLVCGIFLIICEVYKQLFYYYVIGNGSYQWWIFPFQMCSVPMYMLVIVPFLKDGKVKRSLYSFMATYNMLGGFVSLLEPSGLCHEYWTLTLHAFVWHIMLVFIGLYLTISNRANNNIKDFVYSLASFGCCIGVAELLNIIFKNQGINMFYISPYKISPIVVFTQINQQYGWFVNCILYLFALTLGSFIIHIAIVGIKKLYQKKHSD